MKRGVANWAKLLLFANINQFWPETFSCKIEMEIAGTEIQVTAIISTGEKAKAMFNFL